MTDAEAPAAKTEITAEREGGAAESRGDRGRGAGGEGAPRSLVVSIHDVAPPTLARVQAILTELEEAGVRQRTLLVVPRFHGGWSIETDVGFRRFLLSRDPERDEVCLHGYEHLAGAIKHGGLSRMVATRYTEGEGEFYRLETAAAVELIERGRDALAEVGICPRGFVAPAWLHPRELDRELGRLGFLYTTRLWSITVLQPEVRRVAAPVLVYSARRRWRLAASRCWNPCLWQMSRPFRFLRLAIHPRDWDVAAFRSQIRWILRGAVRRRATLSYAAVAEALNREAEG